MPATMIDISGMVAGSDRYSYFVYPEVVVSSDATEIRFILRLPPLLVLLYYTIEPKTTTTAICYHRLQQTISLFGWQVRVFTTTIIRYHFTFEVDGVATDTDVYVYILGQSYAEL